MRMASSSSAARPNVWRLLDTAGGVALGMLLLLGAQAWRTPATTAAAAKQATSTVTIHDWYAGPWAGCTLLAVSQDDMTDGATTVTHQITATWACASALPPALITPVAQAVAPTPTAR